MDIVRQAWGAVGDELGNRPLVGCGEVEAVEHQLPHSPGKRRGPVARQSPTAAL
jgi:hypothetical protein